MKLRCSAADDQVLHPVTIQTIRHCRDLLIARRNLRPIALRLVPSRPHGAPLRGTTGSRRLRYVTCSLDRVQPTVLVAAFPRVCHASIAQPAEGREAARRASHRDDATAAVCSRVQRRRSASGRVRAPLLGGQRLDVGLLESHPQIEPSCLQEPTQGRHGGLAPAILVGRDQRLRDPGSLGQLTLGQTRLDTSKPKQVPGKGASINHTCSIHDRVCTLRSRTDPHGNPQFRRDRSAPWVTLNAP